ncbi:MAG: metal ABC transporter ATP-binding protein [Ruminococcaceae bacterium]|nr:metal ABC transporter ATP-binding protein [Oscillospiraceae bacterium]
MSQMVCKDVSLGYDGNAIVNNLNFTVNKGDYLCVVGENGAGKSTLIKTILGLRSPLKGSIELGDSLKANEIGYLPQQTMVQKDFPASVKEIVLSGALNKTGLSPFYTRKEKELAKKAMESLGITALANRCYRELSGGQQQRVLLARAICATRKLLVLDEPVAGLDPKATAEMYELIKDINKNGETTIIMVSHDISAAMTYATHILHVSREALYFGTKEGYLQSDVAKIFIAKEDEK